VRQSSQEQWDCLDRQRNKEVTALQQQVKAQKQQLDELKADFKTLSSKTLTKEQAAKEALARSHKHARELADMRAGLPRPWLRTCSV
jgi:cell division protein FtsL